MKLSEVSVEKLAEHPLWHDLTDRQKRFLVNFVSSDGQKEQSVESVYNCRDNRSARAMACTLLRKPHIKQILLEVCGFKLTRTHVTRGELLSLISQRLRELKNPREFNQLSGIYAELKGWRKANKNPAGNPRITVVDKSEGSEEDLFRLIQQYEQGNRDGEEE